MNPYRTTETDADPFPTKQDALLSGEHVLELKSASINGEGLELSFYKTAKGRDGWEHIVVSLRVSVPPSFAGVVPGYIGKKIRVSFEPEE